MRYIDIAGESVSAIGLGAGTVAFTPERSDDAAALLDAFLGAGGNCVDTAHIYGFGKSEMTLGRWFEETGRRDETYLVTKGCHPVVDPDDMFARPWLPRVTPKAIRADLDESLRRLRTDRIDLYLLHRDDESLEPGPVIEALNEEKAEGRIVAFGASNWSVGRIEEANRYAADQGLDGFAISSPSLSLARPTRMFFPGTLFADDATREWHRARQFPLLAWSALAVGFASGRLGDDASVDDVARIYFSDDNQGRLDRAKAMGSEKGVPLLEIALAFVLSQPFPITALVGPSTVEHLDEALASLDVALTPEELAYLDLGES
jgi:aryl-alcohol dehydrogenase-like predicted oxidoreductase